MPFQQELQTNQIRAEPKTQTELKFLFLIISTWFWVEIIARFFEANIPMLQLPVCVCNSRVTCGVRGQTLELEMAIAITSAAFPALTERSRGRNRELLSLASHHNNNDNKSPAMVVTEEAAVVIEVWSVCEQRGEHGRVHAFISPGSRGRRRFLRVKSCALASLRSGIGSRTEGRTERTTENREACFARNFNSSSV